MSDNSRLNKITSKDEMYKLYLGGMFGNKLRTWPSLSEYYESNFTENVVLRYRGQGGGGFVAYDLKRISVPTVVAKWVTQGAEPNRITVNESAPDDLILIQGEIMRSTDYLTLSYSTLPYPMRTALKMHRQNAKGIVALEILRFFIDPSSLYDIFMLLDKYDDAVLEFSTWDICIGDVPRRNTVVWEVRNY
ncbi:MAG: hypothetical protein ACKVQS_09560 [Fimbriimonadaceae bacterium]